MQKWQRIGSVPMKKSLCVVPRKLKLILRFKRESWNIEGREVCKDLQHEKISLTKMWRVKTG
jgi:hypothetical protein